MLQGSFLDSALRAFGHSILAKPVQKRGSTLRESFLLILKPELLEPTVNVSELFQLIKKTLHGSEIQIDRYRLIVETDDVRHMTIQYTNLHKGANSGASALSDPFLSRCLEIADGKEILSAKEFLQRTGMSATDLQELANSNGSIKVCNGFYLYHHKLGIVAPCMIANAFGPELISRFSRKPFVVLACSSNLKYDDIHDSAIGFFRPHESDPGSLRRIIYEARHELGIRDMSVLRNGLHVSPSPLEGAIGIRRYFPELSPNTSQLLILLARGRQIDFAVQKILDSNISFDLFDAAELLGTDEVLHLLEDSTIGGKIEEALLS